MHSVRSHPVKEQHVATVMHPLTPILTSEYFSRSSQIEGDSLMALISQWAGLFGSNLIRTDLPSSVERSSTLRAWRVSPASKSSSIPPLGNLLKCPLMRLLSWSFSPGFGFGCTPITSFVLIILVVLAVFLFSPV